MIVYKCDLPDNLLIKSYLDKIDYCDTYFGIINSKTKINPAQVIKQLFIIPPWVIFLLKLRNVIVKPFGLNHDEIDANFKLNGSEIFKKIYENENEIILGEDDKHLDFRISVFTLKLANNQYKIGLTTIVKFNKLLGRLYFIPVKPFHKIIVKRLLYNYLITI